MMADDKRVRGFASTLEMVDDAPSYPGGHVKLELMNDAAKLPGYSSSASNSPDSEQQMIGTHDKRPLVDESAPHSEEKKDGSNIPMASFNMINSIVGSGIIGIPYALRRAGVGVGLILLLLLAAISDYTLNLMVQGGEIAGVDSYQGLLKAGFGKFGFGIITTLQMTSPLVAMISYNIIAGDTITKLIMRVGGDWLRASIFSKRQFVMFLFTVVVTLPLSLYRNVSKLGKWSLVSTICVIAVAVFLVFRLITLGPTIPKSEDAWNFANEGIIQGINIMSSAYVCQHNCFLLYGSLVNRSVGRWAIVSHVSFAFAMTVMMLFGLAGYATFTDFTQGDLLQNYCYSDDLANIARVMYTFTVVLTFPIECFVVRQVFELTFFSEGQPPPLWRHIVSTIVIVSMTTMVSMLTNCLSIILEFNGAICAAPMAFILPSLAYIKLRPEKWTSWRNILPASVIVFGVVVAVIGLGYAIKRIIEGVQCVEGDDIAYCKVANLNFNHTAANISSIDTLFNNTSVWFGNL